MSHEHPSEMGLKILILAAEHGNRIAPEPPFEYISTLALYWAARQGWLSVHHEESQDGKLHTHFDLTPKAIRYLNDRGVATHDTAPDGCGEDLS